MKLPFIRVIQEVPVEYSFNEGKDQISLTGIVKKKGSLFCFDGEFSGTIALTCDSCLADFDNKYREKVILWFCDGEYKNSSNRDDNKDVIEFFNGYIDFDEVVSSEIESIKLDYHKCDKCDKNPIDD